MKHAIFISASAALIFVGVAYGGEISLQWVPQARIEYEGTGYREVPNGWELKVKPWNPAGGLRWREDLSSLWAIQTQYWMNRASYAHEFGNSAGGDNDQKGQTKLALHSLWIDARRALAGSPVEAVFGLNGVRQSFDRKDIVFRGASEPNTAHEVHTALGGHVGFHGQGRGRPDHPRGGPFWDGELLLGHYFWTHNTLTSDQGGIQRGGYSYSFRLETGWARGSSRWSVGYTRQLYEILVPGGRRVTPGTESATASLPINKTDLFGFFLAYTRMY